jgi:tetratricopeptide (TPR) repeat protein
VLADLEAWMNDGRSVAVRVLTARAGTGKTRLALELCDRAAQAGWEAGFLTGEELVRFRAAQNASVWGWRRPTLVVVDYVASRIQPLREWLIELADHRGLEGKPLRVLLLERHADPGGGWWQEVFGWGGGDAEAVHRLLGPAPTPYSLPPLLGLEERRAVLVSILERVGARVRPPEAKASHDFDRRLGEISWGGEPLFVLMAGLVTAKAGFREALALSATDLGLHIARHEVNRIEGIAKSRGIPPRFLSHMAAYVTLCQGLSEEEVEAATEEEKIALKFYSAGDPPMIREALLAALPGETDAVAPVIPDVIGEGVILEALGAGSSMKAQDAISRAARQAQARVTASLVHLIQDYGAARSEPLAWFERYVREREGDLSSLGSLLAQIPQNTLVFRESAAALAARVVELARRQDSGNDLALGLNNLAARLSALGRREEALLAIEEAVAIRRDLSQSRPDAFRPDLAMSLNNLSNRLGDLGRREEALTAIEEAVAIRRDLSHSRPDAFRPDLAMSLNNLSIRLSNLGRQEEALSAIEESVAIRRDLSHSRPDAFRPDLAQSLNNLSNRLSDLGRREEALTAIEEAVEVYRDLSHSRPDAFRPDLALSLNNLSLRLGDLGRREEALTAIEEAVGVYRDLSRSRPDAFRPDLALSLNNLCDCLSDLSRREEALTAIEEAFDILAPYFFARPRAFHVLMDTMVGNYFESIQAAGRQPDQEMLAPIVERLKSVSES